MPYGTLTLHTQRRDITVELVDHRTATRIIRTHTGRVSAAEAFFRGDEIDSDDFDGRSKLISIGLIRVVSIEWDPYPEGDGDLASAPDGDRPLSTTELRRLVRALWRAKDESVGDSPSPDVTGARVDSPTAAADTADDNQSAHTPRGTAAKRTGQAKKSSS